MGDYDSSPMLYCSGVFSHKNSICFEFRGLDNSRMFAHDSAAAFLSIYKETTATTKKQGYDSSPLLLFARRVTVPSNFS